MTMKRIVLTESQLLRLKESQEEVTYYKFFTEVKNFLKNLLEDPICAKCPQFFKDYGISRNGLINRLFERGIIKRNENFNEPTDADGKITSVHTLQYKIPRKNFEQKIKRLYSYYFEGGR